MTSTEATPTPAEQPASDAPLQTSGPRPGGRGSRLRGRPAFYRSYAQEMALLNTRPKAFAVGAIVVLGLLLAFMLTDSLLRTLAIAFAFAIGALGLNIVTGLAGQVSLGHAFFVGIGAYTAAVISGDPEGRHLGFGVTNILVWLLAAGVVAAVFGVLVAPLAARLRGLYLAIVTLGLVFLGQHVFNEWRDVTGGSGVGRAGARGTLFGFEFAEPSAYLTSEQQQYLLLLVLLAVFALGARNLARSRTGRAFAAVRDRDMAAELMAIDLTRTKTVAFAISSFYAGCSGALIYYLITYIEPADFGLLLSVQFIAMILIGGAGTVSGAIMGALFIQMLPTLVREVPQYIGFISASSSDFPNVFQLEEILYGLLIVGFLLFEPRGLFGIWIRIRNYWKSWPFSY